MKLKSYKTGKIKVKSTPRPTKGQEVVWNYRDNGKRTKDDLIRTKRAVKKKAKEWWDAIDDAFSGDN